MSERQYTLSTNGQQVTQADLNLLGEEAGLADDRVLGELLRLTPYNGTTASKAVLPYAHASSGDFDYLVMGNGATGQVKVNPFRALIGSRTAVGTDAKKNWRDVRSAIAVGSTTLHQLVAIAANASGNPRWDLVYAAVSVDANGPNTIRKVKNPTTKVIAGATVVTYLQTTVSLAVVQGTPAASPSWPTIPADAGSTYYIPLAYVRVPNGFTATSTVGVHDIAAVAPPIGVATSGRLRPASAHYTSGSSILPTATVQTWGSGGVKPQHFIPSNLGMGDTLILALDVTTGAAVPASGSIVDTGDWRGRLCRWTAYAYDATSSKFAWGNNAVGTSSVPLQSGVGLSTLNATTNHSLSGIGSSIIVAASDATIAIADGGFLNGMADATDVRINVDQTTGNLKVSYTGNPNCRIIFWLEFTRPFENHLLGA